jgi:hypothetical protein
MASRPSQGSNADRMASAVMSGVHSENGTYPQPADDSGVLKSVGGTYPQPDDGNTFALAGLPQPNATDQNVFAQNLQ